MAFNFPDPADGVTTVVNPITGSTYEWKQPPGKWVIVAKIREVGDIVWEGDVPPDPRGDYKLWYSTDTLELYFWYEDVNGVGAWVPTSAPITMLEDLDEGLSEVKLELIAANVAINENTNRIESFIYFGEEAPTIYPDVDTGNTTPDGTDEGAPIFEQDERNYKLWLNTTTDKLSVLRIDESADVGYSYQEIDTNNNVTLQEVLNNGNVADKGFVLTNLENDAILVSPEDARIMVGGIGENVVPRYELRHETGIHDTSVVKLELDEDGARFDIECDEKVDNIHFRFEDDVKFELNKKGDALFTGGLDVYGKVSSNGIANQGNATFKFGSGQGVVIDSGSTFEPMLELKSYSGPGERKDVFSVNARGNASLLGKLALAPGTQDNEAATYGQLATVVESIEQLAPSYERGKYNLSMEEVTSSNSNNGKYNLIRKNTSSDNNAARRACQDAKDTCNRIPDNDPIDCENQFMQCEAQIPAVGSVDIYTDDFSEVEQIKFSKVDADGTEHQWTEVQVGQLIDVFNDSNSDYLVARITAKEGTSVITLTVDVLQSIGKATGVARIKVFTLNEDVDDLANYVRKTGDTMTGTLKVESTVPLALYVKGNTSSGNSVFYVQDGGGETKFRVRGNGEVQAGTDANHAFMASESHDVVTKKYLDSQISGPTRYSWKRENKSSNPSTGHFCVKDSKFLYFHRNTNNGHTLAYDSGFSTSASSFPGQAYWSGQYAMNGLIHIWKSSVSGSSSAWTLMQMAACYRYRLGHNGLVEIEIRDARGKWGNLSYETEYWISVDGFFN